MRVVFPDFYYFYCFIQTELHSSNGSPGDALLYHAENMRMYEFTMA